VAAEFLKKHFRLSQPASKLSDEQLLQVTLLAGRVVLIEVNFPVL